MNCLLSAQSFHCEITAGGLISQVDGDTYGGYHKISPTVGISVCNTFVKNDKWGMSLELNYRNKGSNSSRKEEESGGFQNFKIDLHYLELPVMGKYEIRKFGTNHLLKHPLFIEFGPAFSCLISGEQTVNSINQREEFTRFELALNAGITYFFAKRWGINYRFSYTFPFTPIRKHPGGQVWLLNRGLYNNCMMLNLIFKI